jgi:hypothetical protein
MMSVFEEWKSYRQRVIPPTAPDIQVIESKRAFYAGGYSLFMLMQKAVSSGEEITKDDLRLMERLAREYKEFYERMQEGKE